MATQLNLRAPEDMDERLEDLAGEGRMKSDVMRDALERGLSDMEQGRNAHAIAIETGKVLTGVGATLLMVAGAIPGNFGLTAGAAVLLVAAVLLTLPHWEPWGSDG